MIVDGSVLFSPGELSLSVNVEENGSISVYTFANYSPIGIWIDVESGSFDSFFVLANAYGAEAFVRLVGQISNRPPVADAGPDQFVDCSGIVTLDGSASTDPDGTFKLYTWFKLLGEEQVLPLGTGEEIDVTLPLGTHEILLEVFDTNGATSRDAVLVTIADVEPPVIDEVKVYPDCLWPPNHKYVRYELGKELFVTAHDECEDAPPNVKIVDVKSNEPDNDTGDGSTVNDAVFGQEALCVRSERRGGSKGREYSIVLEACDAANNCSTETAKVRVPHDMKPSERCEHLDPDKLLDDDDPACDFSSSPSSTLGCSSLGIFPHGESGSGGTTLLLLLGLFIIGSRRRRTI